MISSTLDCGRLYAISHSAHVGCLIVGSRVLNLSDQDIAGAGLSQLVHSNGDLLPLYHDRDCDPAAFLKRGDCRCTVSGGDLLRDVEFRTLDVVLAEDVLLSGYRRQYFG